MPKNCPMLNAGIVNSPNKPMLIKCMEDNCQWWVEVYTTEGLRHKGCAVELLPQMVDGQFRV